MAGRNTRRIGTPACTPLEGGPGASQMRQRGRGSIQVAADAQPHGPVHTTGSSHPAISLAGVSRQPEPASPASRPVPRFTALLSQRLHLVEIEAVAAVLDS